MSEVAIKVENLSKVYRIGAQQKMEYSLRSALTDYFKSRAKRLTGKSLLEGGQDTIWALKNVSFEVNHGEVLGVIGRNGAGKSTLLKILSRITEPSQGRVELRGRVASLLEVGTGFHPELTGRENVFLNGSIMGMRRDEIRSRFDEIVAFAEIEKFIDTPVKRYSSGMYVRLAFSVAAHLHPEILLVDEVLAVGDASFQKKCLGKMGDVTKEGKVVLFVSHNMQAIRSLCPRSILIDDGQIICDETTQKSFSVYYQQMRGIQINAQTGIYNESVRRGGGTIRFTSVEIQDVNGNKRFNFEMGEAIRFVMSYKVYKQMQGLAVYIGLRSGITREFVTSVRHLMSSDPIAEGCRGTVTIELPDIFIRPGEYPLYLHVSDDQLTSKSNFDVLDDLTPPLVITAGQNQKHDDFDTSRPVGYFSLPSQLVSNEINDGSENKRD